MTSVSFVQKIFQKYLLRFLLPAVLPCASLIFVSFPTPTYAEEPHQSYRIIRTSPYEFVSALRTAPQNQKAQQASGSRLAKFFRIKNRVVRDKSIEFEIIPEIPLLPEYFENLTQLKIVMTEESSQNQTYEFDTFIKAKGKKNIHSKVRISPHPLGALLKLQLIDSDYSSWTLKAFSAAAKTMGFLADSPEDALKLNSKGIESQDPQPKAN
jgi:hypothetical protein